MPWVRCWRRFCLKRKAKIASNVFAEKSNIQNDSHWIVVDACASFTLRHLISALWRWRALRRRWNNNIDGRVNELLPFCWCYFDCRHAPDDFEECTCEKSFIFSVNWLCCVHSNGNSNGDYYASNFEIMWKYECTQSHDRFIIDFRFDSWFSPFFCYWPFRHHGQHRVTLSHSSFVRFLFLSFNRFDAHESNSAEKYRNCLAEEKPERKWNRESSGKHMISCSIHSSTNVFDSIEANWKSIAFSFMSWFKCINFLDLHDNELRHAKKMVHETMHAEQDINFTIFINWQRQMTMGFLFAVFFYQNNKFIFVSSLQRVAAKTQEKWN